MIKPSRRGFLFGLAAAPAIVRAGSLMRVTPVLPIAGEGEIWLAHENYWAVANKFSTMYTRSVALPELRGQLATIAEKSFWIVGRETPRATPYMSIPASIRALIELPI